MYLRFHPYKQASLKNNGVENLKPRYYEPYKVIQKIGEVAYELELPEGSKIHNVFHFSCLKKYIGQKVVISDTLPPLDDEGQLTLIPEKGFEDKGEKIEEQNNQIILGAMEGSTKWRCRMERGEYFTEYKYEIDWVQPILGGEDCNVPIQIIA